MNKPLFEFNPGISKMKKAVDLSRRYSLLKDQSRDIILFISPDDGRILEANQAAIKAYGYTYEELLSRTVSDLRAPSTRHLVQDQLLEARTGTIFEAEHLRKDGSTFFVEVSSRGAIFGGERNLISIVRDITGRKKSEQALRLSEAKFVKLFNESPGFLCITDFESGKYLMVNKAYCELTGYSADEMIGKTSVALGFVSEDDRAEMIKILNEVGGTKISESRIKTKKGDFRTRMLSAAVIEFQGKRAIISSGLDITERRRIEAELRQLNQTLGQQVRERTALAETRTRQLQALAVELIETEERERRQFAHLLHEDLQQMLAAAKMQVQAVADTLPSEPMLSNAAALLNEAITKTRRVSHELSPAILHQAGLIAALEWLSRQMREQFGLAVELVLDTELLLERTPQKVFLFRAAQELLFNIIKHAGIMQAKVAVTSSDDSITITVSDEGRGFDPGIVQKRDGKLGFGLLAIKERASYIGGRFRVASAPGQGSRFTLTVPNAVAGDDEMLLQAEPAAEIPAAPGTRSAPSAARGMQVLFVDDHRVMRQGLIKLVQSQSAIQVAGEASNGREAVEQARTLKPDVIIMDISMPELDGIEATRRIKAELPQIRVIGLTMHDDDQLTGAMQRAGAEATLSKTISAAELIKAIIGNPLQQ